MASSALFKAELLTLSRSWVLRGWLIALALTEFFVLSITLLQNRVRPTPASGILATHLNGFLLIWSLVIIVLGASSISMESDVISDGILSRACTRTQYIAAKLLSRAFVVLGIYLLSSAIASYCAWRFAANDMTLATVSAGVLVVGLAVLLMLALGIALSVLFNNTIFAVVGMLLLWYVASPIFSFLGVDYLSPASLTRNLPRILKDPDAPLFLQGAATTTSLTLAFSKNLDPPTAEDPANFLLEGEAGVTYTARTAVYDKARTSVILGGLELPPGKTIKVTVRNVTNAGGVAISPAADSMTVTVPHATSDVAPVAPSTGADLPSGESLTSATAPTSSGYSAAPTGATPRSVGSPAPVSGSRGTVGAAVPAAGLAGSQGSSGYRPPSDTPPSSAAAPRTVSPAQPAPDTPAIRAVPRVVLCIATVSSLRVDFSEDMDPKDAETVENYIIENPAGQTHPAIAAVYNAAARTVLLSGLHLSLDDPTKVTVRNVKDRHGNPISSRANSAVYSEVTVWKYVLGFGIPTLLVSALAMVWFSRRDL